MPEKGNDIAQIVIISTAVFLIAAAFLISYIALYAKRMSQHRKEKEIIRHSFQKELAQSQLEVREQTLQTIAADLHDNIGQILSYTKAVISTIDIQQTEKAVAKIASANDLLQKSIDELRQLARLMQGENILNDGLVAAIEQELNWLNKSNLYQTEFTHQFNLEKENKEITLVLFRLLQEALNNTVKHAMAKTICIRLTLKNNLLELTIQDDGIGFVIDEKKPSSLGLRNIKRRTDLLRGEVEINAMPGKGTIVKITVPYSL